VAKKKGYISQDEILQAFPKPENSIESLDYLYDQLIAKGIDIFETVEEDSDNQKPIEDLEKEIKQKKGFIVQRHSIEFYGLCAECQKKST